MEFPRIKRLPPYLFASLDKMKMEARRAGADIIDFGMGNPDHASPPHVVEKLIEAAGKPPNHRYSTSRGIFKLRLAICDWYKRRFGVELDPDTEAVVTIGSKEGLAHLALAMLGPGDVAICPSPSYPIHHYSIVIANADLRVVPLHPDQDFFASLEETVRQCWPRPKMLLLSFPHNPTTAVVDLDFFHRIVDFAKDNNLFVVHDFAYADLYFDDYRPPSFLQVPGAKDIGVEFFTLSKSYDMPGWRVGFVCGNHEALGALARLKSYFDYGIFQPVQIAAIHALNGPQEYVEAVRQRYKKRRDVLIDGLERIGWSIPKPKGTMFVWSPIPEPFREMGSMEFAKFLLTEAKVSVSPGIGFGPYGEGFVRFALIENEHRTRQAIRGMRKAFGELAVPRLKKAGIG
ncbi:MAG TPA: aminotransferase class I/II-fold pyridoxal phosphate-dependent enzyme [Methylomirabilota bacterium]|jgi:alanine-synthesizing transaminase|nr:aminotransferase class I/II-fold pyridoxal phosphate-dependent enzyme [Methylomirabilota bacterium]